MSNSISHYFKNSDPVLMGILNLTPDSFSDGDQNASLVDFMSRADQMIGDGAHVLDIGGESTRPDADFVDVDTELARVIPFLKEFRKKYPDFPISLDTKKYDVALKAMDYDIQILNDVSFLSDFRFLELAKKHDAFYVLMHSRGHSKNMMRLTDYPQGVIPGIKTEIDEKIEKIRDFDFPSSRLILDLGFGFAKSPAQCEELMEKIGCWRDYYDYPLLLGISRKRFLQRYTGDNQPKERDKISAELALKAFSSGFQIIRTHQVGLTQDLLK